MRIKHLQSKVKETKVPRYFKRSHEVFRIRSYMDQDTPDPDPCFFLDWIQKYKLIPDHFLHCFCLRSGIRLLNPDPDTENFENRQKHRIRNPGRMINDSVNKASAP